MHLLIAATFLQQDHLVCFLGGSLLLGVTEGQGRPNPNDFSEADTDEFFAGTSLISTCMDTYYQTKTGLAPEVGPPFIY